MALCKADSVGIFMVPFLIGLFHVPARVWSTSSAGYAVLALLGTTCLFAATVALDDVRGFRDGSDAVNYAAQDSERGTVRKPLPAGLLTERQALVLAHTAWVLGGALWCTALALAPAQPVSAVALVTVMVFLSPQYSWGLRLSHRILGEAMMLYFSLALTVVLPLLAGTQPTGELLCQAALVALWHLSVSSYANTADAEGDRAVHRQTLATLLTARANRLYLHTLTLTEVALTAVALWCYAPSWWTVVPLLILPARLRDAYHYHQAHNAHAANLHAWRLYLRGGFALVTVGATTQALALLPA